MPIAVIARVYGQPDEAVSVVDVDVPEPGLDQVRVTTTAIGLNPIDLKRMSGAMGADPSALPLALGNEASGVVSAVGNDVDDVRVGDPVIIYPAAGSYAEEVVVKRSSVHARPDTLDDRNAAGLLLVGVTAADIVETLGIGPGDVLLVHGGAGAVGTVTVQLAVAKGARVIATASPRNHEFLRSIGATPVAYGDGLLDRVIAASDQQVTHVADTVGTEEAIDVALRLVDNPGRVVSIAAFGRAADGIVLISGSTPESRAHRNAAVEPLIAAAAAGELITEIAATFPLTEAAAALDALSSSHARGKILLIP